MGQIAIYLICSLRELEREREGEGEGEGVGDGRGEREKDQEIASSIIQPSEF